MLVYVYQAALYCEDCGVKIREDLTAEGKAPADPEDAGSYDSDDFPSGPTEEGESDSPSHCEGCKAFLESELTDAGADNLLQDFERVLRGERDACEVIATWCDHYEGPCGDTRITLRALAENGLTIAEILSALREKGDEVERLKRDLIEREVTVERLMVEVVAAKLELGALKGPGATS